MYMLLRIYVGNGNSNIKLMRAYISIFPRTLWHGNRPYNSKPGTADIADIV